LAEGVITNATLGELKLWGNLFGDGAASLFLQLFEGRFQFELRTADRLSPVHRRRQDVDRAAAIEGRR
jgi:hypothetical protein